MAVKPRDSISFYETVDMMNKMPIKPEETSVPDDPVSKFLMNLGALSLGVSPSEYAKIHGEDAGINYGIGQAAYGGLFALAGMASAKGTQSQQIANDMETLTNAAGLTYKGLDPNNKINLERLSTNVKPSRKLVEKIEPRPSLPLSDDIKLDRLLRGSTADAKFNWELKRYPKAWEAQKQLFMHKQGVVDLAKTVAYKWSSARLQDIQMPDKELMNRINNLNLSYNTLLTITEKNDQQSIPLNQMLDTKPITTVDGMATVYRLDNLGTLMEQNRPRVRGEVDTRGKWSSDSFDVVKRYGQGEASVISTIKTPADNLLFARRNDIGDAKTGEYIIRDLSKVEYVKHDFLDDKNFPIEQRYNERYLPDARPDLIPNIHTKLVPLLKSINAIDAFSKEYPALGELIKSGKPYIKNNN